MLKNKSKDTIKTFTIAMILTLDNKNYNKEQLKKMSILDLLNLLEVLKNNL